MYQVRKPFSEQQIMYLVPQVIVRTIVLVLSTKYSYGTLTVHFFEPCIVCTSSSMDVVQSMVSSLVLSSSLLYLPLLRADAQILSYLFCLPYGSAVAEPPVLTGEHLSSSLSHLSCP